MSDVAIKIENVGKQYRLGLVTTGTLSHDLNRWWKTTILRQEDPYLKIGETNDRTTKGSSDYVWALRDINMEIKKGDVVGIIGKNGAGKSTLLKLLSRVTTPTTGTIKAHGRIGSLLEVGTGFHPEMTGRENIYMNGAILGMSKQEITRKFDEIVDFSGCERYIDTPVKRYSSGMMVRLGFAVAAHLDPEILIVDEVLAVGDAEFQKKAIGKMQDVSKGEGRTVLFVSHNMASVKQLCNCAYLLKNGAVYDNGKTENIVSKYVQENNSFLATNLGEWKDRKGNQIVKFVDVYVTDIHGGRMASVLTGETIVLNFEVFARKSSKIDLGFSFFTPEDVMISNLYSSYQKKTLEIGEGLSIIKCEIEDFSFCSPALLVRGVINVDNQLADWPSCHLTSFNVEKGDYYRTGVLSSSGIQYLFKGKWSVNE